ncbi:prolipoprotein diacylglyceryl transferase [Patescibacteria group bacterium]|nr:prolipoprotein diacylglyceryl transferase [Patescibacteria group bacterium]
MFSLGPISIHWYGFIITCGVIFGFLVSLRLAERYKIKKDQIVDLYFWLIIFGLIGARIYHVLCEWQHYFSNPIDIVKVWNGGLGIYGAVIMGVLVIWFYSKKGEEGLRRLKKAKGAEKAKEGNQKLSIINYQLSVNNTFWLLADILAPALILGQAFGRWGNYFNGEIFGLPTSLPWGIPINALARPEIYQGFEFFHPTFLYQSLLNFIIFGVLIWMHARRIKSNQTIKQSSNQTKELSIINYQLSIPGTIFLTYLTSYSLSRFFLEFLRLDVQPIILGLRLGHWTSGVLVLAGAGLMAWKIARGRELAHGG